MPEENNKDTSLENLALKPCDRCGNPFMVKAGQYAEGDELVCDNCIKLEQRKRRLQIGVFENVIKVENEMEKSINEMKNQLQVNRSQFNKSFFLDKIKRRASALQKSINLIEKIEETNDEKYVDEYKKLFENMKQKSG